MVLVMFMLFGRRSTLLGKAGVLVFHMLVHACEYISRVVLYIALLGPLVSSTGRRSNFRIQRPLRLFVVVVFFFVALRDSFVGCCGFGLPKARHEYAQSVFSVYTTKGAACRAWRQSRQQVSRSPPREALSSAQYAGEISLDRKAYALCSRRSSSSCPACCYFFACCLWFVFYSYLYCFSQQAVAAVRRGAAVAARSSYCCHLQPLAFTSLFYLALHIGHCTSYSRMPLILSLPLSCCRHTPPLCRPLFFVHQVVSYIQRSH